MIMQATDYHPNYFVALRSLFRITSFWRPYDVVSTLWALEQRCLRTEKLKRLARKTLEGGFIGGLKNG